MPPDHKQSLMTKPFYWTAVHVPLLDVPQQQTALSGHSLLMEVTSRHTQ